MTIYHYHAKASHADGHMMSLDGLIESKSGASMGGWLYELRGVIAGQFDPPVHADRVQITSLTRVSGENK